MRDDDLCTLFTYFTSELVPLPCSKCNREKNSILCTREDQGKIVHPSVTSFETERSEVEKGTEGGQYP